MNKYYALQKDVFDISKVTVVGNPTITSDGVASGFSEGNYIKYPITVNATNLRIKGSCIYKSGAVQQRVIGVQGDNTSTITTTMVYLILTPTGFIFDGTVNGTWKRFIQFGIKTFADGDIIDFDITLGLNYQTYNFIVNSEKYSYNTALELSTFAGHTVLFSFSGTGDYNWAGKINLPSTKIYADNQLIYTPTKPTYLLERRKPKVWNKGQFTIVGNPSISDDGVASGFSMNDYLTLPMIFNPQYKTWKIIMKATLGELGTNNYRSLIGSSIKGTDWQGVAMAIRPNGTLTCWLSSTGTGWDIGNINGSKVYTEGKTYYFKIEFTGTKYEVSSSDDGVNWDIQGSLTNSNPIFVSSQPLAVANNRYGVATNNFWKGSIKLKQFKIYVDNNLVFDGGADTYVYDPSKFTIVGSPTITEYGVVSGFSATNYIQPNKIIDLTKSWEVELELTTPSDLTTQNVVFTAGDGETHNTRFCYSFFTINGGFGFNTTYNGTSWGITSQRNTAINPNSKYYVRFGWDEQSYYIMTSLDGDEFNDYVRVDSTEACYRTGNKDTFGNWVGHNQHYPFTGSINLANIITRNSNKELFCGVVENYYMLRR